MKQFLERIANLPPKRLALLAAQLNEKVQALEQAVSPGRSLPEPIAIVGMACRMPGGVENPDGLWQKLHDGCDLVTEIPGDRWSLEDWFDPDVDKPGKAATRWGAFLEGVDRFDHRFFGISPKEAASMDPQQRLLLETVWAALEDGCHAGSGLSRSLTGVFVGICNSDYAQLLLSQHPDQIDAYLASGTAHSIAAGRIAYALGLQGPAIAIDTACSSSLVALHLACQSLRTGECDMAIAGGVNVVLRPELTVALSKSRMMAPDGRCKPFSARADGFTRGEGCGVVVLKRLSDAQSRDDRILAVIRGSACNQDGRSSGLTAPNGAAQEVVIRAALANAGVEPSEISYVEAHGTGTALGDPIEVRALTAALADGREPENRLWIGSIKANVGHLEAAAGIAGLIKLVLAMRHAELPPQLHLESLSPHIDWSPGIGVPASLTPWEAHGGKRLAGLSSFGFSGTNAHFVVEEYREEAPRPVAADRPLHILPLSAKTSTALDSLRSQTAAALREPFPDICYTMAAGRAHFEERVAIVAATSAEASRILVNEEDQLIRGESRPTAPEIAFLFTGQGSHYPGMGRELYDSSPVFRASIDRCAGILGGRLGTPLKDVLFASDDRLLDQTSHAQPALFAFEFALAELWRSWGIEPSIAAGHSLGEYVAACVSGLIGLEDGLRLVAERGRLMQAAPAGAMISAACPLSVAGDVIGRFSGRLSVAAVNALNQVVLSGGTAEVREAVAKLASRGVETRYLPVSRAFHSPLMDPILDEFERVVSSVSFHRLQVPLASNLTGEIADTAQFSRASYWLEHVRKPVLFSASVQAIERAGCRVFLEIGPSPVLCSLARQSAQNGGNLYLPSLDRKASPWKTLLNSLGRLYVHGAAVDWAGFDAPYGRRFVAMPTYPFERERCWIASAGPARRPPAHSEMEGTADLPDLLARSVYEVVWREIEVQEPASARLPSVRELVRQLDASAPDTCRQKDAATYDEFQPEFDELCVAYIVEAIEKLGWRLRDRHPMTPDVARELRVLPRHARLLARILEILVQEGILAFEADQWRVLTAPGGASSHDLAARLLNNQSKFRAEIQFTFQCGTALAEVMRGQLEPLDVLFPGGSADLAEDMYERSPGFQVFNSLIAEIFSEIRSHSPASRTRILEIGAGTGSTTRSILEALEGSEFEYAFTDVSPVFLNRARTKFADRPQLRYRKLDIEQSPQQQQFEPHSFDVVVASNVLHATKSLRETLAHVKTLLARGGLLVLLEGTVPQRFGDITVGLTEGWWRFADHDLRPSYPLISRAGWTQLLSEEGFEDACEAPRRNPEFSLLDQQCIFLARTPSGAKDRLRVVISNNAEDAERVSQALAMGGETASLIRTDALADADVLSLATDLVYVPDREPAPAECILSDALSLVQRLLAVEQSKRPRLWLVTRNAQEAGPPRSDWELAQSTLWGFARTLSLENPEIPVVCVDLDSSSESTATLAHVFADPPAGEPAIAIRGKSVLVRRLATAPLARKDYAIDPGGAYLVTGAFGGLGLEVAGWLVRRGGRRLILMGRSAPSARAEHAMAEWSRQGAEIVVIRGDVADENVVRTAIEAAGSLSARLKGIIHSAGALDDGIIAHQTPARFQRVLAAKVAGSWNLHRLSLEEPLDFFLLFSSGSSLVGSPGQSNHSAANAYLDALAHYRAALDQPAMAINWGAWGEVGAATRNAARGRIGISGLRSIALTDGLIATESLMSLRDAQRAVLPIDWPQFHRSAPDLAESRLLLEVLPESLRLETRTTEHSAAPDEDDESRLRRSIEAEVIRVMGMRPSERIPYDRSLSDLGLDSLMAIDLRNAFSRQLGKPLPASLLFNYPTIDQLTVFLLSEAGNTADDRTVPAVDTAMDEDESELAAMLSAKLRQLK